MRPTFGWSRSTGTCTAGAAIEPSSATAAEAAAVAAQAAGEMGGPVVQAPVMRDQPKVGRNDPCPCGSGKKYKQCHGKLA